MEKYFSLPHMGDLLIEHTFYMLDEEPILFVCKGAGDTRFLCSCCRLYERWVIGQTSEAALINMIDDKITIREVFEVCDTKFGIRWNGETFKIEEEFPDSLLPKVGAKLELAREKVGAYREDLVRYQRQKKSVQQAIEQGQKAFKQLQQYQKVYESILEEWQSLVPTLEKFSAAVSTTISAQLRHQNTEYWEKLSQYINSIPATKEKENERQVQVEVVSMKSTECMNSQTSQSDEIQWLAA